MKSPLGMKKEVIFGFFLSPGKRMRPRFLARLDEGLRGFAGEIEKNLARQQIYGLDKFVPCIIPPKGDSRIGQAVDVRGMAAKLARLRSVPGRLYEQRRN